MQSDRETITLKRSEFVHIDNAPRGDGYGGNQGTFSTDDFWSVDSIISESGCGNIAGSNVILYWALQNPDNANEITDIAIKDGRIELEDFKNFSRHMHETYFPVARWIWSYVKKKYKLNMPFLVLSYPAKASALLSNAA